MLSDTDTACGHCFSPVFNKRMESPLDHRVGQTNATIHVRKSHDRRNGVFDSTGPSFDGVIKTVTPHSLRKY